MDIQRLRNLTTGRLHTPIGNIYEDIEYITGEEGVMTHMLPNALRAMQWWLRDKVTDQRFWDGEYDVTHKGDYPLDPMTPDEQKMFWQNFADQPSPFAGKEVIAVVVD